MGLINFILNLAGLLLWLGWRDARVDTLMPATAASLIRTLRRAGPSEWKRWKYFGGLAGLLLGRSVFYEWIGPAVNWTPRLSLGPIVLPFRSELFSRMLLFSLFSFGLMLATFYLSLLFLSLINRRLTDAEPLQRFVRRHLGRVEGWPGLIKLVFPLVAAIGLWLLLSPLLAYMEIIPALPMGVRFRQGALVGVGLCLVWKYVVGGMFLLHFLNNHIYFGSQALWNYVNATARQLLAPLRGLPLRIGRVDFTPVAGIGLVFLAAEILERWLPKFYPS